VDRWYLWHNLSEAAEQAVSQSSHCLRALVPETSEPEPESVQGEAPSGSLWPTGHRFADHARAQHAAVRALLEAGHSLRSVQWQLSMGGHTVKRFADASKSEDRLWFNSVGP
jgi:hypothetical protein